MFHQIANSYSFHDTKIDRITKLSNGVVLCFNEGIHVLNATKSDENKTDSIKTSHCIGSRSFF